MLNIVCSYVISRFGTVFFICKFMGLYTSLVLANVIPVFIRSLSGKISMDYI